MQPLPMPTLLLYKIPAFFGKKLVDYVILVQCQGLRASSLQFTSPLEFNAIFRYGFPLRVDLNGWSKIRVPVTAKLKHAQLL